MYLTLSFVFYYFSNFAKLYIDRKRFSFSFFFFFGMGNNVNFQFTSTDEWKYGEQNLSWNVYY